MSQAGALGKGGRGTPGSPVLYLQGDTGGPIGVDPSDIIYLIGSENVSTAGDAPNNRIVISAAGYRAQLISVNTDLVNNISYICVSPGGNLVCTLPATSLLGDRISISLDGSTSFQLAQRAGQQVRFGNQQTTAGIGGSLTTTTQGDSLTMICTIPDTRWVVTASMGNLLVV